MWLDTIKLGFGNSLVKAAVTDKITPERIIERIMNHREVAIESFGLFDSSQPNYTTYYPDVTAEDLNPDDKEFIYPMFRALSEVIVHKNYNPVDFSTPGVLKKSMGLLVGATVNPDHESNIVGNAIGSVKRTAWEDSYKTENGIVVPAGILSQFKLDGKSNPRIARGIMMDPPSIHSTSVTVQFLWDKSHPNMTDDEFFQKLSTYDKDGKMIRRMATKVKKYPEISLVAHGADPYAQKIGKNGQINNPKYADVTYNSEEVKLIKEQKYFFFDFKTDLIMNSEEPTIPANSNDDKTQSDMNPFSKLIAVKLGLAEDATEEQVTTKLTEVIAAQTAAQTSVTSLTTQHTTDEATITRLTAEITALKAASPAAAEVARLQAFETKTLTDARTALSALYNKLTDNKPEAGITAMIANASLEAVAALTTQYGSQLEAKFPQKCGKCGSTNISRASAVPGSGDQKTDGVKSLDETTQEIYTNKKKTSIGMPHETFKK